jgi:hypothetical protein
MDFEVWQVVVGGLAVLVSATSVAFTIALKYFGGAFKHWGDKFDSFQIGVNKRLDHMEQTFSTRLKSQEEHARAIQDKYHDLTLRLERRMTWLEAQNNSDKKSGI